MGNTEPFLPIQVFFLIGVFPVLYKSHFFIQDNVEQKDIEFNYYCIFRHTTSNIDLSKNVFITTYFGQEKISNTGQFKKYMHAISTIVPGATVIFGVSEFTTVDPSFDNYEINLNVEKYGNETISYLSRKYPNAYQYYYNGFRYKFYVDYLESHPRIENAIFTDVDMLILKNPFELLKENLEEVHFMYDYKPFYRKGDKNYLWANAWAFLDNNIKTSCGITILNKSLDDVSILPQIPWNVGLMMGSAKNLITICRFISDAFFCPGMFQNNAEQGLLNYAVLTGQIFTLGIKFHGHHVIDGAFMSCPHSLNVNVFRERIQSRKVYAIHHYQILKPWYIKACYPELIEFINYE